MLARHRRATVRGDEKIDPMARPSLTLLGGFEARLDSGAGLALPTHKYKALLAYLAVPLGHAHPRDKLVALLWADKPHEQGRAAVRQAMWALRRALEPAATPVLVLDGDTIALNAEAIDVDVAEFESAAGAADRASLARAAALYRGAFLAGLAAREAPFEEWLLVQRERLAELALGVLARQIAMEREAGRPDAALQAAHRLLAIDPLQEAVHRAVMQLHVELGRPASALRQYETCVGLLHRELGMEPDAETRALYQQIVARRSPRRDLARSGASVSPGAAIFGLPERTLVDAGPLVGRETELELLGQALDAATAGRGGVAVVVGEAGIGKSRLVAALAAEAAARGARVIVGHAYESEQVVPFGPWVDVLRSDQLAHDDAALTDVPASWRAALGQLVPELARGEGVPSAALDYRRLFEAVLRLVSALAARRPLVLVLEDMHWADDMSLRLFSFIARRTHDTARLLLVLTARLEDLDTSVLLPRVLDDVDRSVPLLQLSLGPLDREDTARLISALSRARLDGAALARLTERVWIASGGNPFVVVESVQASREEPVSPGADELPLPERVRRLVGGRLERLGPAARELVAVAAVIGRDFAFSLLHRASGLDETAAVAGVEELVRRRVFASTGDRLDFTHHHVRDVAAGTLLPARRRLLHRRVAEAIEALPPDHLPAQAATLGHHYAEAEIWTRAVVHLDAAGVRAIDDAAYREALATLRRALDAVTHLPRSRDAIEREVDIRLHLIRLLHLMGDVAAMGEQVRGVEALAATLGDRRREAVARINTCDYFRQIHDHTAAMAAGRAGLALAEALGDEWLQAMAHFKIASCHQAMHEHEAALPHLRGAMACGAEAAPERLVLPYLPAAAWLVYGLAQLGRYDEAEREAEAMRRLGEARAPHLVFVPWALGMLALRQDRLSEAIESLAHALELCREQRFGLMRFVTAGQLARAYALAGWPREAEALLEETLALLPGRDIPHYQTRALVPLAQTALALGRVDDARRMAQRALEIAQASRKTRDAAEARGVVAAAGSVSS